MAKGLMAFPLWRAIAEGRALAATIATRRGTSGDRHCLNVAHELGHLTLNPSEEVDEEKAAFRFGAAFLAPAEAFASAKLGEKRTMHPAFRRSPLPQVALRN